MKAIPTGLRPIVIPLPRLSIRVDWRSRSCFGQHLSLTKLMDCFTVVSTPFNGSPEITCAFGAVFSSNSDLHTKKKKEKEPIPDLCEFCRWCQLFPVRELVVFFSLSPTSLTPPCKPGLFFFLNGTSTHPPPNTWIVL